MEKIDENKHEENLYYLKLYAVTDEYDEMIKIVESLSYEKTYDLNENEMNNTIKCMKGFIKQVSSQYLKLREYRIKEKRLHELFLDVYKAKKKDYKDSLEQCVKICNNFLTNNISINPKNKIAFTKLLADFLDMTYDFTSNEDYMFQASKYYEEAYSLIQRYKQIKINDIVTLTLYLNYSVFLSNKMENISSGCRIAREALNRLTAEGISVKSKDNSDLIFLSQLIKDNLSIWTTKEIIEEKRNKKNTKIDINVDM